SSATHRHTRERPNVSNPGEPAKMKVFIISSTILPVVSIGAALAQSANIPSISLKMEIHGNGANSKAAQNVSPFNLEQFPSDIPTNELSKLAQNPISEASGTTRSAKDAQIYRMASPSVVMVVNKEGFGSGSLLSVGGDILTNWHVVKDYSYVA